MISRSPMRMAALSAPFRSPESASLSSRSKQAVQPTRAHWRGEAVFYPLRDPATAATGRVTSRAPMPTPLARRQGVRKDWRPAPEGASQRHSTHFGPPHSRTVRPSPERALASAPHRATDAFSARPRSHTSTPSRHHRFLRIRGSQCRQQQRTASASPYSAAHDQRCPAACPLPFTDVGMLAHGVGELLAITVPQRLHHPDNRRVSCDVIVSPTARPATSTLIDPGFDDVDLFLRQGPCEASVCRRPPRSTTADRARHCFPQCAPFAPTRFMSRPAAGPAAVRAFAGTGRDTPRSVA